MNSQNYDYLIIGAGIIGLSIAKEIIDNEPCSKILILEKEPDAGFGQTGNNSGVLHSGIYYKPESLKSRLCIEGKILWEKFCEDQQIPIENTGKLIVATCKDEYAQLNRLKSNAKKINLSFEEWSREKITKHGGYGEQGIFIPSTKSIDFRLALHALKQYVLNRGVNIVFREKVVKIENKLVITKSKFSYSASEIIISAGINVDLLAPNSDYFIFGFTGLYFKSKKLRESNILIYPAPNPKLPFLGVHTCKAQEGFEYFGPSAVPSLKRTPISLKTRPYFLRLGTLRLLAKYWKFGLKEIYLSISKKAFLKEIRKVVSYKISSLDWGFSGTRAQCVSSKGELVDDFVIEKSNNMLILRNVPSPAATSSLSIAKHIYHFYYEAKS